MMALGAGERVGGACVHPSAPLVRWRISASSCSAAASDPHE